MDTDLNANEIRNELLQAIQNLSNRCLYQASKWAAEALNGLTLPDGDRTAASPLPTINNDRVIFAKTLFDCHEYDRCAHSLEKIDNDPHAIFLKLYAKYISGEKKKEEEHEGVLTPKDNLSPNQQIVPIVRELEQVSDSYKNEDPYLLYLYGVVLIQQKNEKEAISKLLKSINLFPYNWSAWLELLQCIPTIDKLNGILYKLPANHLMTKIFIIHAQQELYQYDEDILSNIDSLQENVFSNNFQFLTIQQALINYHGLNYQESEGNFDKIIASDPYRLDDMDTYSNILYVMERRSKLAFLAQLSSNTDKFRSETCCIIANYYSLKSEHEKAIVYYQRALILNRYALSAWTLMGHEFVELKNTHAAIESYRRAVDANKKDYRAWYGLGQAYEVLEMHYYSLYYYQRATSLKPYDIRMWQALGHCFDKLDRVDEAIKSYKRALKIANLDALILLKIAILYEKLHDYETASIYMKQCLSEEAEAEDEESSQARLWLAKYELKRGNYLKAHDYAENVIRGTANEIEDARAIVRETKSRLNYNTNNSSSSRRYNN